jgi:hypothetical protein
MGQKSRRKGVKATPGGIIARNITTNALSPLKQLGNFSAATISNNAKTTPSADRHVKVR